MGVQSRSAEPKIIKLSTFHNEFFIEFFGVGNGFLDFQIETKIQLFTILIIMDFYLFNR